VAPATTTKRLVAIPPSWVWERRATVTDIAKPFSGLESGRRNAVKGSLWGDKGPDEKIINPSCPFMSKTLSIIVAARQRDESARAGYSSRNTGATLY
jgi:hypothetical protein